MSEKNTGKVVRVSYDPANPPELTEKLRAQLGALDRLTDDQIDFSDIPRQAGKGHWTRPGLFGGPLGALRRDALRERLLLLDPDVAEYFSDAGEGSADTMNHVLREYMERHQKSA